MSKNPRNLCRAIPSMNGSLGKNSNVKLGGPVGGPVATLATSMAFKFYHVRIAATLMFKGGHSSYATFPVAKFCQPGLEI